MWTNNDLFYWPWLTIMPELRPLRTVPESKKDEAYHVKCARFYMCSQSSFAYNTFRYQLAMNTMALQPGWWGLPEDWETFLKDSYGNQVSRKTLNQHIISPMLNRLKGQARNLGISGEAISTTPQYVKNREEVKKAKALLKVKAAQASPEMAAMMSDMYGVSDDEQETEQALMNGYTDPLKRAIDLMVTNLAAMNDMEGGREKNAERLALAGIIGSEANLFGKHIAWRDIAPEDIIWDTTAKRPDFQDGSFVGTCPFMDPADIAERWGLPEDVLRKMEECVNSTGVYNSTDGTKFPMGKPRVFTLHFRDVRYVTRAFVMKDKEPHLCILDEEKNGVTYTMKDVIDYPKNPRNEHYFKGKNTRRVALQTVRTCSFIPNEYLPFEWPERNANPKINRPADYVLDWGLCPFQEEDPFYADGVKFPIKLSACTYVGGNVLAPISYAISPQRFVNQMTSAIAWYLAKAGGKGPIIDSKSIDPEYMNEAKLSIAMKEGDMAIVNGHGMGVNQSIGEYDTTPDQSLMSMFTMLQQGVAIGQQSTGISDTAQGAPLKPDQLVGTTELLLQQTNMVNMPFFGALIDLYKQMHQFDAQVGKQFYTKDPPTLRELVGDDGADAMLMDPDAPNEKYRIEVEISLDEKTRKENARQLVMMLAAPPYGWIDAKTGGELLSVGAYPEDVWAAIVKLGQQREEAAKAQAQDQQKAAALGALDQQQQRVDIQKDAFNKDLTIATDTAAKNQQKLEQPFADGAAQSMFPPPEKQGAAAA